MATAEIKGLFSKEHGALIVLIIIGFYYNQGTRDMQTKILSQQQEIKADLKLIKYRLNNEKKLVLLDKKNTERPGRESILQKTNTTICSSMYNSLSLYK